MNPDRIFIYALYAGAGLVAGGAIGFGAVLAMARGVVGLLSLVLE